MDILSKLIREPLLHFLVLGGGVFVLFNLMNGDTEEKPDQIVITQGQVEMLAANYSRVWQRSPSDSELANLVDNYLRDEVYYRQAIALGLDKDDILIRKRMRQKLEFILEDVSSLMDPTDEELADYMRRNEDKFRLQPQLSFRHVYLNPDKRVDVRADADELLAELAAGGNAGQLGDPIMLDAELALSPQSDIDRRFGDGFSRQLLTLTPGVWSGPHVSGFGVHIVLVGERVEGRVPDLNEVKEQVEREWLLERTEAIKEDTFRQLLQSYDVVTQAAL